MMSVSNTSCGTVTGGAGTGTGTGTDTGAGIGAGTGAGGPGTTAVAAEEPLEQNCVGVATAAIRVLQILVLQMARP